MGYVRSGIIVVYQGRLPGGGWPTGGLIEQLEVEVQSEAIICSDTGLHNSSPRWQS
jgi:hypothetical protein